MGKILVSVVFLAGGCANGQSVQLQFQAMVGTQPFDCTRSYDGVGVTKTTIQPIDFRMYVSSIELIRANGDHVPFTIEDRAPWQGQDIALLDFENATGTCVGSPETNLVVTGHAPSHGDYVGVKYVIGVPMALNHLNAPVAKPPLNVPGLWWSWMGGYKFLKLEVASSKNNDWFVHIGASECGGVPNSYSCTYQNQSVSTMMGFDPAHSVIVADLMALYANSDLDHQIDYKTEFIPGCMAERDNDQCPPIFKHLGMSLQSDAPAATPQDFFHLQPRS
jgi:uncharacterized repeat protein (TIGR04052 family)